jgi:hypothetical protein
VRREGGTRSGWIAGDPPSIGASPRSRATRGDDGGGAERAEDDESERRRGRRAGDVAAARAPRRPPDGGEGAAVSVGALVFAAGVAAAAGALRSAITFVTQRLREEHTVVSGHALSGPQRCTATSRFPASPSDAPCVVDPTCTQSG